MSALRRLNDRIAANWVAFSVLMLAMLTFLISILYAPIITANFQGDDYGFLGYLFFNYPALLEGRGLAEWLVSFPWLSYLPYFRPVLQLFNLLDYTAWGLNPIGYHLTNLLLHLLTAFLVYLLCWELTRERFAAVAGAMFFAIMPIHVEAVSWFAARADGLSATWYVLSVVCFVLFRRRGRTIFLTASVVSFAMALFIKEVAFTLPLILVLYDLLYRRRDLHARGWLVPYTLFALGFVVYFGLRFATRGTSGAVELTRTFEWDYLSQLFTLGITDPLFSDMTGELRWAIIGITLVLLALFRRREMWLGAAWTVITIVPSLLGINATIFDRYFYLPSIGLALVLGSIAANPLPALGKYSRALGGALVLGLFLFYGHALYARNEEWARAAQITQIVTDQARAAHPALRPDAQLVFVNVPVLVGGRQMQAFGNMLPSAMQILYRNPSLQVVNLQKFPVLGDHLDNTYFFDYSRRKLTERADLISLLKQRRRCSNTSIPEVNWAFSDSALDWEPWNQLTGFEIRDGMLLTRSQGNDPYMASPEIDIPAIAMGDVQITMRVVADQPTVEGAVYWHASSKPDFEPGLYQSFAVRADGEFHTYSVDIGGTGKLFIGDHLIRLRLDPVDTPGEIAIKSIQVNVHCFGVKDNFCTCAP